MTPKLFRERCRAEWKRLNPRYVGEDDTPGRALLLAAREGGIGYFAPLRLIWWLQIRSWRT